MLFAAIDKGRLTISNMGSDVPEISVSYKERPKLVAYFEKKLKDSRWDGHIMNSSSMDWSKDGGWPKPEARSYIDECVKMALDVLRSKKRKQTAGVVRQLSPDARIARRDALIEAEEMIRRAADPYDHPDINTLKFLADELRERADQCVVTDEAPVKKKKRKS